MAPSLLVLISGVLLYFAVRYGVRDGINSSCIVKKQNDTNEDWTESLDSMKHSDGKSDQNMS